MAKGKRSRSKSRSISRGKANKRGLRKQIKNDVAKSNKWKVVFGTLVPTSGRPRKEKNLFTVVAEKIPFEFLNDVKKHLKKNDLPRSGIYLAHDSMGAVRYAGRGNIFSRLRTRHKSQSLELNYFSFYVIKNKQHEREIETLIIRAASHLLLFNEKKKRPTIMPGNIKDYEARTKFYERQRKKGKKMGKRKRTKRLRKGTRKLGRP